jgi:epoxide hydrolase 4
MQNNEALYERELVKVNGVILHVIKAGPADGERVILLHGFPEFWYGWRHQIDALAAAGYRVIVPDQRGYNQSDKPKEIHQYTIEKLVGDVNGLIVHERRESVNIIGHDWGANVAWWLALLNPRRVKKLGILNAPHPQVFRQTLGRDFEQTLRSTYAVFFQLPHLPEALMSSRNYQTMAQAVRDTAKPDTFTDADMQMYREAWSKPGALRSMLHWYRAYGQIPPAMPDNVRLKMPVLMIWGMQDTALSSKMTAPSIALCDNGRLVTIPDATHWVQHDAKDQVNQLLLEFLKM